MNETEQPPNDEPKPEMAETISSDQKSTDRGYSACLPWITAIVCSICLGVFIKYVASDENDDYKKFAMIGYCSAEEIWNGAAWGLVTPAFIHIEIWHLGLNLYWLWVLGSCLERQMGAWCFLPFYLLAAIVTSSFQLAAGDSTGIGASGVVYAIFGYIWHARDRVPEFQRILNPEIISLSFGWLFLCIPLTLTGILNVANVAHFAGLAWGIMVAEWIFGNRRKLSMAGIVATLGLAIAVLFWCPWSVAWLTIQAYQTHQKGDLPKALSWYDRIIQIDPGHQWARENRDNIKTQLLSQEVYELSQKAYQAQENGDIQSAIEWYDKVLQLDRGDQSTRETFAVAKENRLSLEVYEIATKAYQAHTSGDLHSALELYDKAIQLDPNYQWATVNRAMAEAQLESLENGGPTADQ